MRGTGVALSGSPSTGGSGAGAPAGTGRVCSCCRPCRGEADAGDGGAQPRFLGDKFPVLPVMLLSLQPLGCIAESWNGLRWKEP